MTAGTLSLDNQHSPRPLKFKWGSFGEFLITGGATLLMIPFALWYRRSAGLEDSVHMVSWAAFYAAYVINDPHFAVSYLLFYKNTKARADGTEFQGAQRIRFLVAGFLVPALLAGWVAYAFIQHSAVVLGRMILLMFFLVGWHYVKQGFGVLMVLSSRKGIFFSTLERRLLLFHCFAGWAYSWLSPRSQGGFQEDNGVVFEALYHPPYLEEISLALFATSTLGLLYIVVERVRKGQPMPPIAATTGFLMSIWLWMVYSNFDPLITYVIPGLHSLQYWYFVYLLKKNETRQMNQTESLGWKGWQRLGLLFATTCGLAYIGFYGVPEFLDLHATATTAKMGPDPEVSTIGLGATPYVAAFATFINIHHYFMDHVIWRRENPDTRFLRD